jgi:hypothetical protein
MSIAGPSKLTQVLAFLRAEPKLSLAGVKSLRVCFAEKNDHWGARCVNNMYYFFFAECACAAIS